ncbi:cupin domain-containing protein [Glutamicibacter creatinolyticus]|uniref:cupin domain-containing protein n=1 Tax=Glutamicibacter creatinolyticus TaxID=162496 RepID=UPI0031D35FD9
MAKESGTPQESTLIAQSVQDYVERNPVKSGKYSAKRIFAGQMVQITEIALDAGVELPDHKARTPILVQVIDGEVDFTVGGEVHRLGVGGVIHLEEMVPHAVFAPEPTRITVTFLNR